MKYFAANPMFPNLAIRNAFEMQLVIEKKQNAWVTFVQIPKFSYAVVVHFFQSEIQSVGCFFFTA